MKKTYAKAVVLFNYAKRVLGLGTSVSYRLAMARRAIWLPPLALGAGLVLAASTVAPAQAKPGQPGQRYPALLPGKWQSLQAPRSVLLITRTTYQEKYPGFPDSKLTYRITNTCPDPDAPKLIGKQKDFLKQKDILVAYDAGSGVRYRAALRAGPHPRPLPEGEGSQSSANGCNR